MKKLLKRMLAVGLVLILMLSTAPVSGVPDFFSIRASAKTIREYNQGDLVSFGWYPQKDVTTSMGSVLNPIAPKWKNWVSYRYYSSNTGHGSSDGQMTPKDFMRYCDVFYNGSKYRGVRFTAYRPSRTTFSSDRSHQDDNGYVINSIYWFKFEPLQWRVLDPDAGLVLCEKIIDSQAFNNYIITIDHSEYYGNEAKTYYANSYAKCSLRQWLKEELLIAAFSPSQQKIIQNSFLNNDAYSTTYSRYNCEPTFDKIFLLSYAQANNLNYFSSDYTRKARGTDYAKCQGLSLGADNISYWYLRSAGYESQYACTSVSAGLTSTNKGVDTACCGVRPALAFNQTSSIFQSDVSEVGMQENKIEFDSNYYWTGEGFYSDLTGVTDSLEIYIQLPKIMSFVSNANGVNNVQLSSPITMTATVDSSALSFDLETYQSSYSTVFDQFEESLCWNDLILLYPQEGFSGDAPYTVTLTFSSDDFETVTEHCSFYVHNLPHSESNFAAHINFWRNDSTFNISKRNYYGHSIQELSTDAEYRWSRFSSLDFKNYYDVVVADLLSEVLSVAQPQVKLIPNWIKSWKKNADSIRKGLNTMVFDQYGKLYDVSELKIDKLIKSSKYTKDGIWTEDVLYRAVVNMFGNTENVSRFTNVFAFADKLNMWNDVFKWGVNVINDTLDGINKLTLLESFSDADEALKDVVREIYKSIPSSNSQMREAFYDYLEYDMSSSGEMKEYIKTIFDTSWNITMTTFKSVIGKKIVNFLAAKLVTWVGNIELASGTAVLSSTAAFSTVTSALSGFFTGVSLGFAVSDALCNSSDKAKEMAKAITMAEYSPYIIIAMADTFANMCQNPSEYNCDCFEYAFALHKAAQVYIVEHTRKAMEYKRNSLMYLFADKTSMDEVISDVLYQQSVFERMQCHSDTGSTQNTTRRMVNLTSSGNVVVYNQNGTAVCSISGDRVQNDSSDILCSTSENDKYILLPNDNQYTVKIVAAENETMTYNVSTISEEGSNSEFENHNIPLVAGQEYVSNIAENDPDTQPDYSVLSIAQLPLKRVFVVGEAFQTEGLQLSVYKNGGISQTLSDGFNCSCANFDSIGTQFVTVSYGGLQTGYDIQIKNRFSGDINADDELDLKDVTVLCRHLAGGWNVDIHSPNADVNNDNTVNLKDAVLIRRYLAGGWNVALI